MPLSISIPTASVSATDKPYTQYHISLAQPLRTTTVLKRYSDFVALHDALTSQTGAPPPAPLPAKSWFHRTVNNPTLTEERRRGLEAYLTAIADSDDARWRHSSAWRSFLNLTAADAGASGSGGASREPLPGKGGMNIKDASTWLKVHQDLKSQLHQARLALTRREQAQTAQAQHEAGAQAKKNLVLAGTLIVAMEEGLKTLSGAPKTNGTAVRAAHKRGNSNDDWAVEKLGEGEIRRRRDLITSARKEKEGLEAVLNAMAVKTAAGGNTSSLGYASGQATPGDKAGLFHGGANNSSSSIATTTSSRRTLGAPLPETKKTRELDNQGVLQLQKQIMAEQEEDVQDLAKAVRRMREMGVQIGDELELQNEMLRMLDEDTSRVGGKINVAKKRIGKIS
ncbi:hypothetical protein K490DRAFT_60972 [Saccharata proteae CBS 121410]|uniref:Phox-like protein n=1 Tax=Saccharata proteae CBS 121410 TaxID=1314787 RepID=A0A9P4I301_9PEZI|nr:hypothetical protein K490DRAFT_60972 [Saccharata proteae CBS 121410]